MMRKLKTSQYQRTTPNTEEQQKYKEIFLKNNLLFQDYQFQKQNPNPKIKHTYSNNVRLASSGRFNFQISNFRSGINTNSNTNLVQKHKQNFFIMNQNAKTQNNTQGSTACETNNNTKSINQKHQLNSVDFTNNETAQQSKLLEENKNLPKFKSVVRINRNQGIVGQNFMTSKQQAQLYKIQEKLEKDRNDINYQTNIQKKLSSQNQQQQSQQKQQQQQSSQKQQQSSQKQQQSLQKQQQQQQQSQFTKKKIDDALQTAKLLNFQKQDQEEELGFQGLIATLQFL